MSRVLVSSWLAVLLAAGAPGCGKSAEPGGAPAAEAAEERAERPEREQAPPASKLLAVGTPAPEFSSEAHDGTVVSPAAMRGSPWVLYFYPKDETPG